MNVNVRSANQNMTCMRRWLKMEYDITGLIIELEKNSSLSITQINEVLRALDKAKIFSKTSRGE
jgi:hypothetical protein